ncbi:hypothetical protein AMTRI_Chr03g137980 [Amborella trichopoda]|uniref:EF-hand domain-containing protein n=1 Tax=Amborella trichopoda TaxID=13333 RepID=W1PTR5_AMBTC|nr:putative calcium-binding protein CML19 [Amborella trichopoda]ERN11448.1 hypothetical protein AMTR_s00022p00067280 [Amborella trichopoda]|eukprot:XP_006849867.1 putative calcium-binding protein CML19 [Amborella trichopoda]
MIQRVNSTKTTRFSPPNSPPKSPQNSSSPLTKLYRKLRPSSLDSGRNSPEPCPASPGNTVPLPGNAVALPENSQISIRVERRKFDGYEAVFRYFDTDGDGKISPQELGHCLQKMGENFSDFQLKELVTGTDSDGDGLLDFGDFFRLIDTEKEEDKGRGLREAFVMYEMEGLGIITPKSLKRMLSKLGEHRSIEECTTMIQHYDINGDGVLSFDEFKLMMR